MILWYKRKPVGTNTKVKKKKHHPYTSKPLISGGKVVKSFYEIFDIKVIQDVNTDFMGGWCRDTPDGSAFALSQSCGLGIGQRHRVCCLCCRAPRTRPLKVHAVLRHCSMSAPVVFLPIRLHGGEWRTVNTKLFVIPNTPLKMLWWKAPPHPRLSYIKLCCLSGN